MMFCNRSLPKMRSALTNFGAMASLRADGAQWIHADWATVYNNSRCTANKSTARASHELDDDRFVHSACRWQTKVGTDSFFVANVRALHQKHKLWTEALPNVQPFYAIKSNPDKKLMSVLHSLGCGFDAASQNEIDSVLELGVQPDSIIFANPCKQEAHLQHAKNKNVHAMTFDSVEELHKIADIHPDAECVLRLAVDDSAAFFKFSEKFGASPDQVPVLLREAKALDLNVIGVSFHVGSANDGCNAHAQGVAQAREAFEIAEEIGHDMHLLDIGGGWPGHEGSEELFQKMAEGVQKQLENFPKHVKVVAEPGRFFAESYMSLATQVHSRSRMRGEGKAYHISEGVSGVLRDALIDPGCFDHKVVKFDSHMRDFGDGGTTQQEALVPTTILGPSDHPRDCVVKQTDLPEIAVGDWLVFKNVGAYTSVFDDYGPPTVYVTQ